MHSFFVTSDETKYGRVLVYTGAPSMQSLFLGLQAHLLEGNGQGRDRGSKQNYSSWPLAVLLYHRISTCIWEMHCQALMNVERSCGKAHTASGMQEAIWKHQPPCALKQIYAECCDLKRNRHSISTKGCVCVRGKKDVLKTACWAFKWLLKCCLLIKPLSIISILKRQI